MKKIKLFLIACFLSISIFGTPILYLCADNSSRVFNSKNISYGLEFEKHISKHVLINALFKFQADFHGKGDSLIKAKFIL
jgi:hypothetical protein